jgi:membrane fusion protein (multidrug efflux system)
MENQLPTTTPKKKMVPKIIGGIIGIAILLYAGKSVYHSFTHESTDNAQIETNTIPIVSRLAGYMQTVYINDYDTVTAGDTLAVIDNREYTIAIDQAQADLLSAQADLATAEAQLNSSVVNKSVVDANLDVQQTRLNKAKTDLDRDQHLFKDNTITGKQLDDTKANYETTQKQLKANRDQLKYAESQINNSRAQIEKVRAQIKAKQASLENAQLRLSYTCLIAPISGKIGKANLQTGQYVQPGQTLFTIVNNQEYWVTANFKETQLADLREGMTAKIILDGYPEVTINGTITSLSNATGARFALLPPDNATGNFVKVTQRVPVKITLQNMQEIKTYLKAGLSLTVEVKTN